MTSGISLPPASGSFQFGEHRHITFDTEKDAVAYLRSKLEPYFMTLSEVQMEHLDGKRIRMDMLVIPRNDSPVEMRRGLFGIEIKSGFKEARDYNKALKQAIDYRHSQVIDRRCRKQRHKVPTFVFVFPAFTHHLGYQRGWYMGSERLAGMFNVGTIHESHCGQDGWVLEFSVSGSPIWRENKGIVGHINFGTARRRGAA